MTGFYDLMLLIDPNAPEERRTAAITEAESLIGSGGTLAGSYDWGQRRMAYEIDHRPEADYRLYQFEGVGGQFNPYDKMQFDATWNATVSYRIPLGGRIVNASR